MAVLYVGGGMIASGSMTAGGLTRFAMQVTNSILQSILYCQVKINVIFSSMSQSAFVGIGFSGLSTFYSDMVKSLDAAAR
jgi:hypothetical protein